MAHNELVQSLLRAVDVLELVAQTERGLTLAEVCTSLGMKSSTAHNIIRTLVARDLIERTTSPVRFRIGPAVFRLAEERNNHMVVRHASQVMRDLFERIKTFMPQKLGPRDEAAVSFTQYWGGEVVMLLRLRMQRPGVMERPRIQMSPYESAAALCFQAYWAADEIESYRYRHPMSAHTLALWKSPEKIDLFLQRVRELGYSRPPIFKPEDFRCAVPIWAQGDRLIGALGLGVWLDKPFTESRKVIKEMIQASRQIGENF